ncbi:hypothetical protein GE09DRAFT_1226427 [Coniochaeta sp. 2T2.1]|nr:hypothetical protein GE09DRAFT_1226427 [Coniochaeta sp. 2T2.1]
MSQSNNSDGQQGPSTDSPALTRSQLAQALQDLARGEQTANALENNLSKLESKLDELLASFEESHDEAGGEGDSATKDSAALPKSAEKGHGDGQEPLEKKAD